MAAAKDQKAKFDAPAVDWTNELTLASLPETQRGFGTQIYYSPNLGGVLTYGSGNLAYIRNAKNPAICDTFTTNEHKGRIQVVVVSPNGEWIASGDDKGFVVVWGSRPGQHNVKNKVQVGKNVLDLCWSSDSMRIVAVGDGVEQKAKCFDYASGNTFGAIEGHSAKILSVTFKPTRPFRVVTCAEDYAVNFYEGPPFKWTSALTQQMPGGHTRFPNCVRYSPTGSHYISVGADSKVLLFEGKDGKFLKDLAADAKDAHKNSAITSVSWSPSGKQFLTSSLDKTVKLWDFDEKNGSAVVAKTFTFVKGAKGVGASTQVPDQQVATVWADEQPISVSLSGALNYLDPATPDTPKKIVQGHQRDVRGFAVDTKNNALYTTDDYGVLARWDIATGAASFFTGCPRPHDNGKALVACGVTTDGAKVITVGLDDQVRYHDTKTAVFNTAGTALGGQPTGLGVAKTDKDLAAVTTSNDKLVLTRDGKIVSTTALGFSGRCVSFSNDDKQLAVGGADGKVRTYSVSAADGKVALTATLEGHNGRVTAITYAADGSFIASTDVNRQILLWKDGKQQNSTGWTFHNSTVNDLAFSPNTSLLATVASDQDVIIWSDLKTYEHKYQRLVLAHPQGADHVTFVSNDKIITSGTDRCLRVWTYKAPSK